MRFLTLVLALALVGCGETEPKETEDTEDTDDTNEEFFPDEDQDGYTSDVDCDDNDYRIHPGATEECDEVDNNCDGEVDEGFDADVDGYYSADLCAYGDDCDDTTATIHPGAEEIAYNGIDEDCDGEDLEDVDGDGYDAVEVGGFDCDDDDASIHPGAEEIAKDGIDQDCDGGDLLDGDGDGYDDLELGGEDCDDEDPSVFPGAFDWMNDGIDSDCDEEDGLPLELSDALVTIRGSSSWSDLVGNDVLLCDIDEDGMDDLVVSAPFTGSSTYEGQVGVFYGSGYATWSAGMSMSDADVQINGADPFLGFGTLCDDLDGDGHMDLAIGRGEINYPAAGVDTDFEIMLFYGDGTGFTASMDDTDADAILTYDLGTPEGQSYVQSPEFTSSDLDGDGASEIFVFIDRLYYTDTTVYALANVDHPHILVIPGGSYSTNGDMVDEVDLSLRMDATDSALDIAVVTDLDGDGADDIYVGQPGYYPDTADTAADTGWNNPGVGSFLPVPSTSGDLIREHTIASIWGTNNHQFGWDSSFTDYDADGLQDALISARYEGTNRDKAGAVYFFSDVASTATSLELDAATVATSTITGENRDGWLGYRLAPVQDADSDGSTDLLVTEYYGGKGDVGTIWLFGGHLLGSDLDASDAAILAWNGEEEGLGTGEAMASGDIDGDGIPDYAFGARSWGASYFSGKIYIYLSTDMGAPTK